MPKRGISRLLARFNDWFDHQADRYGRVIAWALHHRRWMALIAVASLVAPALQAKFGGSSFLPAGDAGFLAIEVRTPSSSSLEYAKLKVDAAAALARTLPETKATNSLCQPGRRAHLCRHRQEHRAPAQSPPSRWPTCASSRRAWSAASTWCWTT
jgi:HAE1 family hydrophobic/amphiphilic exporter-1